MDENNFIEGSENHHDKRKSIWLRWVIVAVCLCLIIAVVIIVANIGRAKIQYADLERNPVDLLSMSMEYGLPDGYYTLFFDNDAQELIQQGAIPELDFIGSDWSCPIEVVFTSDDKPYYIKCLWSEGGNYFDSKVVIFVSSDGHGYFDISDSGAKTTLDTDTGSVEITAGELETEVITVKAAQFIKEGVYYTLVGTNLGYMQMDLAVIALAENGVDLDAFTKDSGVAVVEWYTSPSYEACLSDESFGCYVPSYFPDGVRFNSAERNYSFLDTVNGRSIDELTIIYSGTINYSVTIAWADSYGINGWAGPMLDASELSPDAIEQYVSTTNNNGTPRDNSNTVFGVWFGDVMVCINGDNLDAETACDIMLSVLEENNDDEHGSEIRDNIIICWSSFLTIDGFEYTSEFTDIEGELIKPGEVIGVCGWNAESRGTNKPDNGATIISAFIPEGGEIYEWVGFDESYRVCAYADGGYLVGFQCNETMYYKELAEKEAKVSELNDFGNQVTKIDIMEWDSFSSEPIGEISDPEAISLVMDAIMESRYTTGAWEAYSDWQMNWYWEEGTEPQYAIIFRLGDGISETMVVFADSGLTIFGSRFYMPEQALEILKDAIVSTRAVLPLNAVNGGLVSGQNFYDEAYDFDRHVLWDCYIDTMENDTLYLAWTLKSYDRWVIDEGPVSCLQREGNFVYYLNAGGQIMRLSNRGVRDEASLYDSLLDGADIMDFIESELYDERSWADFTLVDSVFYTLDFSGNLYMDGNLLAEGVLEYSIDYDGVNYISPDGLWRIYSKSGEKALLVEGSIKSHTAGIGKVYYSSGGAVYTVPAAGGKPSLIAEIDAAQIIYTPEYRSLAMVEDVTGALILDIFGADEPYIAIESGIESIGFKNNDYILAAGTDDLYFISVGSYREKLVDYGDNWPEEFNDFLYTTRSEMLLDYQRDTWVNNALEYNDMPPPTELIISHSEGDVTAPSASRALSILAEALGISDSGEPCDWTITEISGAWKLENEAGVIYTVDLKTRIIEKQ